MKKKVQFKEDETVKEEDIAVKEEDTDDESDDQVSQG